MGQLIDKKSILRVIPRAANSMELVFRLLSGSLP